MHESWKYNKSILPFFPDDFDNSPKDPTPAPPDHEQPNCTHHVKLLANGINVCRKTHTNGHEVSRRIRECPTVNPPPTTVSALASRLSVSAGRFQQALTSKLLNQKRHKKRQSIPFSRLYDTQKRENK